MDEPQNRLHAVLFHDYVLLRHPPGRSGGAHARRVKSSARIDGKGERVAGGCATGVAKVASSVTARASSFREGCTGEQQHTHRHSVLANRRQFDGRATLEDFHHMPRQHRSNGGAERFADEG